MKLMRVVDELFGFAQKDRIIKEQVRRENDIVYGARALQANMGMFARNTKDYDIFSKKSKQSADTLQHNLDKASGGDYYYSTPSKFHKGTYKVYYVGADKRKGTKDDVGIVDFTTTPRPEPKTNRINGIRYVRVGETLKDKQRALKDKAYAFRHAKDRGDVERIKTFRTIQKATRRY